MDDCRYCDTPFNHRFVDCLGNFCVHGRKTNLVACKPNKRTVFNPFNRAVFGTGCRDNHSVACIAFRCTRRPHRNCDFGHKQHRRYFTFTRHRTWRGGSRGLHCAYDDCRNRRSPTLGYIWVLKPSLFQLSRVCTVESWQKKKLRPKRPAQIFLGQKF